MSMVISYSFKGACWLAIVTMFLPACSGPPEVPGRIDAAGIENVIRLNNDLFSGGEPSGEDAFEALSDLGIKTIISVDGLRPNAKAAAEHGITTIHLPMGYSQISGRQVASLIKAVEVSEKPIYVHCHHGRHRAPAAAAIAARGLYAWDAEHAEGWMQRAGTSKDYKGLYKSVAELEAPSAAERAAMAQEFVPYTEAEPIVRVMAAADRHWDNLGLIRAAGWSRSLPEISPENEALMMMELFRELSRSDDADDYPTGMKDEMQEAADLFEDFHQALAGESTDHIKERLFLSLRQSCKSCHERHRD